ncbi:SHOCT domain-containing protein [Hoeflea alexandrii]|uniref:SHOCT domain-containing protein n=1 Tax=Hoeflea alexandrii TaxID=288436 RepID=UPI0022AE8631|nr:SHOCT domain-containing protein [Hoeflea alexandrii]MCZ4292348.1 SHOCT domain-containing protein [Hoeflea alexandrii]
MTKKLLSQLTKSVALVPLSATAALADVGEIPGGNVPYQYGHGMMWGGDQWGGFGMVLGPIFMILVLVGIVAAVIFVMRYMGSGLVPGTGQSSSRAHDILKERYARGEIDSKEFDERKKLLSD